jgi:CHAT domain-containing protein/Tfp pilus assembly protein PilF
MTRRLALAALLAITLTSRADGPLPPAERQQLEEQARELNDKAFQLFQAGKLTDALALARQTLAIRERLYTGLDHPDLVESYHSLEGILSRMGNPEQALSYALKALAMNERRYPPERFKNGDPALALSLDKVGACLQEMGQLSKALSYCEKALAMYRTLYPEADYPDGRPELAYCLTNMGLMLKEAGSPEKALPFFEQALAMFRKLESKHPGSHRDLAVGLNNMGFVLEAMGEPEKALAFFEQALAMRRKLYPESEYPDGHHHLEVSLNNTGYALQALGLHQKALPYYEQALAMNERLYAKRDHPDLARRLNNLGGLFLDMREYDKALSFYERALAMRERLYPPERFKDGHPELALSVRNLGHVLVVMGEYDKALSHSEKALAMYERLYPPQRYPDGHPELARSLLSMASLWQSRQEYEKALPYFEKGLAMYRTWGRRLIAIASEAEALAFARQRAFTYDAFLSLTLHLPDTTASAYRSLWASKSAITRVLEHRNAAARVAGTAQAAQLKQLKDTRRRIEQLLQDRRLKPEERDKLLTKYSDERDELERQLASAVPMLKRAEELDALGPDALIALLPRGVALLDMVRYRRFEFDRDKPGKAGAKLIDSYAVFVLAAGQPIRRIELGEAKEIDEKVAQWRETIARRAESAAADDVRRQVWNKLAPHLPAGTKTLYLAPDGDLARVPWCALPIGGGKVLLEEYTLAVVPHGPFLLGALKYPREPSTAQAAVLVGGVDYNSKTWPDLPGTTAELTTLTPLAPQAPTLVTKADATPKRLAELLPAARYAHLATHGYFDAETLTAEKQRAAQALKSRQFGDETRRVAGKNPLGFTGVVLSGGEIMSGLSIVDLPLENLKLVTLSACETGLGDLTGGEGVQGLQRAFHLAGCPNVMASLWKVNDAATSALMAKFYHELWVGKKPPLEALREAQLTIYRRPDLIPDLAGERGAPKLKEAVAVKSGDPPPKEVDAKKHIDTKLWAAFVLSGVGK